MRVYRVFAYKRWDPEKRTVITETVRAKDPEDALAKLERHDLIGVKVERIKGLKALVAHCTADIK